METKILQIFYGVDNLPYKDKERQVHFPITGQSFSGASLTTEIRFYVRDIGGVDGITWIANAKRADGKIAYKQLSATHDDDVNEYYVSLQLSQWFTEKKGDLFIALNGYAGGVDIQVDSESGLYTVSETPIIQATGSIKVIIAYAPIMNNGYGSVPLVSVQEALGVVSSKLDKNSTKYIKVLDSLAEINSSSNSEYLNEGDIIAVRDDGNSRFELFELSGTYPNFEANELAIFIEYGYFNDLIANGATFSETDNVMFADINESLSWLLYQKADKSNTYTKEQVDDLIDSVRTNEISLVDTTTYPTLSSFLSSTGQEGIIYLYPVENEQNDYYKYIWENNSWLSLGTTNFDFTQYYNKDETNALLNAKENVSNKTTSISNTSTDTQYPSAKAVYDLTQDIREVAEGKCKTNIIDTTFSISYIKDQLELITGAIRNAYLWTSNGEIDIKNDILTTTTYDNVLNPNFDTNNTSFNLSSGYLVFRKPAGTDVLFVSLSDLDIKNGDIFLIIKVDVPDRWAQVYPSYIVLHKLETSKIDLTNYYTKNASLVPTTTNTDDLGSSSYTFKDLYLSGSAYVGSLATDTIKDSANGTRLTLSSSGYAYFNAHTLPSSTNTRDLGSPSYTWKDLYLSGSINLGSSKIEVDQYNQLRFGTSSGYPNLFYGSIIPLYANVYDLGSSTAKFKDIWVNNLKGVATMTQSEYDNLATKDPDTFYFIEEE